MVAVGDVYELVCELTDSNNYVKALNVFHFRQKAGFLSAINLIGEWQTYLEASYRNLFTSGAAIRRYACRSLIPYNTDFYETVLSPTLPGTGDISPVPSVAAGIITWRTGQPGRRKRGRSYIPWISYNYAGSGQLHPLYIRDRMDPFGNLMLSRFGPAGASPQTEFGIWSRVNAGPDPPFNPAGFTVVTSFTSQPNVGSMGSRRVGRGM